MDRTEDSVLCPVQSHIWVTNSTVLCLPPKGHIYHQNFVHTVALKVISGVENVHCCSEVLIIT